MGFCDFLRAVTVAALMSFGSMTAFGNVIPFGGCVGSPCSGTLDVFSNLPGTMLDFASVNFTAIDAQNNPRYGGQLRSAVYQNGAGTLDFYYQFSSANITGYDAVGRLTMTDFGAFTTNAGYRMDNWDGPGAFVVGTQAALSADRSIGGGTIGFGFGGGADKIDPGEISATLVIRTNAYAYKAGSVTTQNGAVYTMAAFAPTTSAIPEPGTYALLGAGLIAIAAIRRRK